MFIRFLFFQQLHASDKEYSVASELLAVGVESTDETNATYLKGLFLLSRAMILMIDRKMSDVPTIFHQASLVIENSITNIQLKEYLKVFYLVLQVNIILCLQSVIYSRHSHQIFHYIVIIIGMLLSISGSSQDRKTESEAATAEYPVGNGAKLAAR